MLRKVSLETLMIKNIIIICHRPWRVQRRRVHGVHGMAMTAVCLWSYAWCKCMNLIVGMSQSDATTCIVHKHTITQLHHNSLLTIIVQYSWHIDTDVGWKPQG